MTWDTVVRLHASIGRAKNAAFPSSSPTTGFGAVPLVGGPTCAYPEWELDDFELFRTIMGAFIDGAGREVGSQ